MGTPKITPPVGDHPKETSVTRPLTRRERHHARAVARSIARGARRRTPAQVTASANVLITLGVVYAIFAPLAVYGAFTREHEPRRWFTAVFCTFAAWFCLTYGVKLRKWARRFVTFPHVVTIGRDPMHPGVLHVDLDAVYAHVRLTDPPFPVTVTNINDGRGLYTITDLLNTPARHQEV